MTLGERIFQIRTQTGLSQEQFGEKLGTTRQTVSKWELDQTMPELNKIVMISRIFSVTTDSLLVEGISTFDVESERFICGVYKGSQCEIVETECYALQYYCNDDKTVIGTKLYSGFADNKKLIAVCERNARLEKTFFAFKTEGNVKSNSKEHEKMLGETFNTLLKHKMKRTEQFYIDKSNSAVPTVEEVGIKNCLERWRMCDRFISGADCIMLSLCTGKTEYIFSIYLQDENIYCGISYNIPFDLGLQSAGQFFRIRNYKDNSEPSCAFRCDFGYEMPVINIKAEDCQFGQCVSTSNGIMWCIKRYTNDEIVLQGCGEDEYTYKRNDKKTEKFTFV